MFVLSGLHFKEALLTGCILRTSYPQLRVLDEDRDVKKESFSCRCAKMYRYESCRESSKAK